MIYVYKGFDGEPADVKISDDNGVIGYARHKTTEQKIDHKLYTFEGPNGKPDKRCSLAKKTEFGVQILFGEFIGTRQ